LVVSGGVLISGVVAQVERVPAWGVRIRWNVGDRETAWAGTDQTDRSARLVGVGFPKQVDGSGVLVNGSSGEASSLPGCWRTELAARLRPGESIEAWFEPDLDANQRYQTGLVVLTDRRLIGTEGRSPDDARDGRGWREWPLETPARLKAREHAGVGTLEVIGPEALLGSWRYTAGRASAVHRLVERFEACRRSERGETQGVAESASTCPLCGAALAADQESCPVCAPAPSPPMSASLTRLGKFARPWLPATIGGFVLTLLSTWVSLLPTYLTQPLTDRVLFPLWTAATEAERAGLIGLAGWYLGALAASAAAAWLLSWWRGYVLAWVSERIAADLRDQTYAHLQRLSLEYFGGKRTGDLMSRISDDTERICNFLSVNLLDFATDVLMVLITCVYLFSMDWALALSALLPFPVIWWLVHATRRRMLHGFDRSYRAWAELASVLADTIPGIRVVKAFAQERREIERFQSTNARILKANDEVNWTWASFGPAVTLFTSLGLLIVWGVGVARISQGALLPGALIASQLFISRFYVRMESMSRMVQAVQRAAAAAQRLFEILDRVPSVPEPTRPVHPGRLRGEIELRQVSFRYGSRPVLSHLNLKIQPGEMIGLVGRSGAGKSTLINLICRFFDVKEGAILVDGVDIRRYPVEEYRRNIGIVLQDPFLFYGTIAENIAYGQPGASREEIVAAARAARAHEFILRLPEGYDSMVGERGQSLSGGERQRISIARALLIDPRILILDEATSAVDTETERQIQEALEHLIQGRTTIAIAHRLSTLRRADRLVVMDRGRFAEIGHHQELLKTPGAYARLHKAQVELAGVSP
jgi:ATP-binding cassette subfamily B protein